MPYGPDSLGAPLAVLAAADEVLGLPEADERLLSAVEMERADRFRHESSRREFVAAHLLVRFCAARLLGVRPAEVAFAQRCPGCGQDGHGRPLLTDRPDVHLSLAHTDGVVAAAAGPAPVGIDVEAISRKAPEPELLAQVLTPAEVDLVTGHADPAGAFLRQWVRKEALIKIGRAELDTLSALDLSALPLEPSPAEPARHRFEDLHLVDVTDPLRGVLAAVVSPVPPLLGTASVPLADLP
jgi:4'-phosphopantetheinyl transferase